MLEINYSTVAELEAAPNFGALLDEYAAESAIHGLPHPKAKMELYKLMETTGVLEAVGAWADDKLIGFITVTTCVLPHYGEYISATESFFVSKAERSTGAGLRLLRAAECIARRLNAKGLLISAPIGGTLAEVLELTDYRETNRVFFKGFAMNSVATTHNTIPAMTDEAVGKVRALESVVAALPQIKMDTNHVLHAGMYARTVMIPAGAIITGALISVRTTLIVSGHCHVYLDGKDHEMIGYNVLAAEAHRKQAFVAVTDTHLTMLFKTNAMCVADAEEEFTDEAHLLISRAEGAINHITVTEGA
jgi:GNAT superfamily N-acetyltransferase